MKRGEVWTVSGGPDYGGKPRPAVILQDDRFEAIASKTVCLFTTNPTDVPGARPLVKPGDENGLTSPCRLMVDKIMTFPKTKLGRRIGKLDEFDMGRLERALIVFLGLAG